MGQEQEALPQMGNINDAAVTGLNVGPYDIEQSATFPKLAPAPAKPIEAPI